MNPMQSPNTGVGKKLYSTELGGDFSGTLNSLVSQPTRDSRCGGYKTWTDSGWEYDCSYNTTLDCGECKFGGGRKNPLAKCNQAG